MIKSFGILASSQLNIESCGTLESYRDFYISIFYSYEVTWECIDQISSFIIYFNCKVNSKLLLKIYWSALAVYCQNSELLTKLIICYKLQLFLQWNPSQPSNLTFFTRPLKLRTKTSTGTITKMSDSLIPKLHKNCDKGENKSITFFNSVVIFLTD